MPSTDTVSNVSGRNSRASNVSANTGASRSLRSPPPPHDSWTTAGVLSMLKTSTDTGDIGALSFNSSRLPTLPRNAHTKRGHVKRPSTSAPPQQSTGVSSNHSYAPSQNSRISSQWDASSAHRRGSLASMQSNPPSIPPVHLSGKPPLGTMPPTPDTRRDSRSYSMTSALPGQPLPRHQSATSLKSQGHEPRHGPRMAAGVPMPPGMAESRPTFVYPTRLKRPGYRSPSPALSDTYAGHVPPPGAYPIGRGMPAPRGPPSGAYNGYTANYPMEYTQDPRHLNVRPPPRTANSSPNNVVFESNQYNYRAGPPRQVPCLGMPQQMPQPAMHQGMPPMPVPQQSQQASRAQYGPQYAGRPGYAHFPPMQYPGQRGPPPNPQVAPMAHQMFHNAARMARHLPHRTDTPMTDLSPPSSDPPSSGSAPTSSNPPTPKNHTNLRVAVDPALIDPALMDLQSSSSEPVLPAKYFEYADGPLDEQDMEVLHPSVPPSGFVQRVKAMLESKAMVESAAENDLNSHEALLHNHQLMHRYTMEHDQDEVSELQEFHEMAANETPRFTVVEEFEAPVELPASPVKVPELEANEVASPPSTQRITRDMIRAELGPSSADNTLQKSPSVDSAPSLIIRQEQHEKAQDNPVPSPDDLDHQADFDSRKSSPQPVESLHQNNTAENETVTTDNVSIPTEIDYALRFCAPVESTMYENETQSKDVFALDADTITVQQQQQQVKETSLQAESHQELRDPPSPELVREPRSKAFSIAPVSPLRSDEVVKRSSAVSPLHNYTMGIDETMDIGSQEMTMTTNAEESGETGLYTEDSLPPPTPRTPKTYSKSVELNSNVNGPDHVTTNTNRFSLPGDLSIMGDTTTCSASEMVTDMAVRFSLPGTTITVGKPQIVDVSAGSTPDKLRFDFGLPLHTLQSAEPRKRTSSVTFADEVAPLNFQKKQEPLHLQKIPESSAIKAKSIIRKPSPREDLTESSRTTSRDSTTDLRFNGTNAIFMSKGFGSRHLPGLKEESIEDMSISSRKRSSEIASFPLPARIAAVKAMQEKRLQETADKNKARRQARQYNRSLADSRDLPSLNFSRMDLIDKLNQALDLRTTKSLDVMRRRDFSGIHCPSPQRPLSTEPLRDRYTSFFSKPNEFSFFDETDDSDGEDQVIERDNKHDPERLDNPNTEMALVPVLQIQEQTEIEGVEPGKRPLSPEDFLSVASQVNRLSIPSVNGLSERLSELIPGLKNLNSLQLDNVLSNEDDDSAHAVHGRELARPDTVLTNRTSAGFRTLAERAEEIVKNGTHDSIIAAMRALSLNMNKELPALPGSASVDMLAGISTAPDVKTCYLSGSVSVPTDLHKDPTRPVSALLRAKTPTTEDEVRRMLPSGLNPIARNARRSMILSHPTSRPWNLDKNYPWSGDEVEIDLSVPDEAHIRASSTKEVVLKRGTRSLDLTSRGEATESSQGIDVGDLVDTRLDSTASLTTLQLTSITPQHLRIPSKRSIIGSISKKFGLSARSGAEEDATLKTLQSRSPIARVSSADHHSHRAGDRYPTSGLTPPANFNIDEGAKTKSTRLGAPRGHSIDIGNTTYDAGSMAEARLGTNSSANTYDGVGMSKTEFHIKRFGEKLRHLFAKGGELIRTISTKSRGRGRMDHNQDEWLADSLYSGV